ncbi:twin-arginine translocation signal domain-containing protein [Pseudomonas parafulva]|uniref:twin-arginine translocation signal domain-containing protein n=1 Tax=Pseudomonas parafulva TaxID=157782 RepID=UPI0018D9B12D|nr:twin-arginine translocation signal domain-containing protein [Pseudomonas parafulva]
MSTQNTNDREATQESGVAADRRGFLKAAGIAAAGAALHRWRLPPWPKPRNAAATAARRTPSAGASWATWTSRSWASAA